MKEKIGKKFLFCVINKYYISNIRKRTKNFVKLKLVPLIQKKCYAFLLYSLERPQWCAFYSNVVLYVTARYLNFINNARPSV